jgi:hypothetical protein
MHEFIRSLEVANEADSLDVDRISIAGNVSRLAALFEAMKQGEAVALASRKIAKKSANGDKPPEPETPKPVALPGEDPAQTEARLAQEKYGALTVEKVLKLMRCMDAADPANQGQILDPANVRALIDLFETEKWGAPLSSLRVRVCNAWCVGDCV